MTPSSNTYSNNNSIVLQQQESVQSQEAVHSTVQENQDQLNTSTSHQNVNQSSSGLVATRVQEIETSGLSTIHILAARSLSQSATDILIVAVSNNLARVQELLKNNSSYNVSGSNPVPLSDSARAALGLALYQAVKDKKWGFMITLLQSGAILPQNRATAVVEALRQGRQDMAQLLLHCRNNNPNETRRIAMDNAANLALFGCYLTLFKDAILHKVPMSETDRSFAVTVATKNEDLKTIQALLDNGPISTTTRGGCVWLASEKGYLEIVQTLLENGEIGEAHREGAIQIATKNGHEAHPLLYTK